MCLSVLGMFYDKVQLLNGQTSIFVIHGTIWTGLKYYLSFAINCHTYFSELRPQGCDFASLLIRIGENSIFLLHCYYYTAQHTCRPRLHTYTHRTHWQAVIGGYVTVIGHLPSAPDHAWLEPQVKVGSKQLVYSQYVCVFAVPLFSPGNLRVSEEWYNRFRVTWDPPQSPTVGYRIVYQPIYGTHTQILLSLPPCDVFCKCRNIKMSTQKHLFNYFTQHCTNAPWRIL